MKRNRGWLDITVLLWCAFVPYISSAHHSVAGFFNPNELVEIEGVVTATLWRNPHMEFEVEVAAPSGEVTKWRVETGGLGVLRARGLAREFLRVGDRVRVMGNESLRGLSEVFARNLLLNSGKEVLLTVGSARYFSLLGTGELLESIYDEETERAARRDSDELFRVWSTNIEEIPSSGARMFQGDYPLTEEAEVRRAEWDPGDIDLLGCTEWNMPNLTGNPLPMKFVRQGGDILQRFEIDDNERLIHMSGDPGNDPNVYTPLGNSVGRWEGDSLVVETTNIESDVLDFRGTPFSSAINLLERFTPNSDGSRLDYRITITDPDTFTEPFELARYWIWRPEIPLGNYACGEEQQLGDSRASE